MKRIINKIIRETRDPLIDCIKASKTKRFFKKFTQDSSLSLLKRPERQKPHILFIIEKWVDCNPSTGKTNTYDNLIYTLEASNAATYSCFHYDEYSLSHDDLDIQIIKECGEIKPDMIVFDFVSGYKNNVLPKTMQIISESFKIPIVLLLFDSAYKLVLRIAEKYAPFVKKIIVWDTSSSYGSRPLLKSKSIHLWTPQNPKIFFNPGKERNIDISFAGSSENYPDRKKAIGHILKNGIDIYVTGGHRERNISIEEYADLYKRSKIVLNFPYTTKGELQFKGRALEAMLCGAALMELNNLAINNWFKPMEEYIAYDDLDDLIRKIKYFLSHEEDLERIRQNGYLKATNQYNAKIFWEKVISLAMN